jgi:hypothetical protein
MVRTYIAILAGLALAATGCREKPKNIIGDWTDPETGTHTTVEALDEKGRRVTIEQEKTDEQEKANAVLTGDGEDPDPDTAVVTLDGQVGKYGAAGQPPIPPQSKGTYAGAVARAAQRVDERVGGMNPEPTLAATTQAGPRLTPDPNVLYGPKIMGGSDITLESLADGTGKLTITNGDLTWVLYDKDGDLVPETGERTEGGSKPGTYGGPNQRAIPAKIAALYKRIVEDIALELGKEADKLYKPTAAATTPTQTSSTQTTPATTTPATGTNPNPTQPTTPPTQPTTPPTQPTTPPTPGTNQPSGPGPDPQGATAPIPPAGAGLFNALVNYLRSD